MYNICVCRYKNSFTTASTHRQLALGLPERSYKAANQRKTRKTGGYAYRFCKF